MTQARWPSSVVAARSVSARRASVVAARSTCAERAVGPRQRLLDVRFGVADQLAEERQGAADDLGVDGRAGGRPWVIVAIVEPTSRRSQRDGE